MKKGKIIFGLVLVFLIISFSFIQAPKKTFSISAETEKALKSGETKVLIKLNEGSGEKNILSAENAKEKIKEQIGEEKIKHDFKEGISAIISYEELKNLSLSNTASVELIPERHIFLQTSVPLINATTNWNVQYSGTNLTGIGETICIIDTGVNYSHADLGGCYGDNNASSSCKVIGGWDYVNSDDDPMDDNGHGTHISGIVAANGSIKGVAPSARIIMIKACNAAGSCSSDDVKAGIDWCVNNASTFNISVISMSLGADCDLYPEDCYSTYCNEEFEASSINAAVAKNISVVIATGNDGNLTHISSPSCVQNATSVGSIRKNDATFDYNRNSITKFIAPGYSINSTYLLSAGGNYASGSGTSMATPHVAGAFALLNQLIKKQDNRNATVSEIENVLNLTAKKINDTGGSNLIYSRIDVYNASIFLDNKAPSVTLYSPANNTLNYTANQTFICNATDEFGLKNSTFYLWNSTSLVNETSFNLSGLSNTSTVNISNLATETYYWTCYFYDLGENLNSSSNKTLIIGNISVELISPENNSYSNQQNMTFNCSAQSESTKSLSNLTWYIWNSTELYYTETVNLTGFSNYTNITKNISAEGNYSWNCEATNNASQNRLASSNRTVFYDNSYPSLALVSPENSGSYTTTTVTFQYIVLDNFNISNCSLFIDGVLNETDNSILNGTNTVTKTFSNGNFNWSINCSDGASLVNNSETRIFSVAIPTTTVENTGGGGGGGGSISSLYSPSTTQVQAGYSAKLKEKDKIKFSIKEENHTITTDKIYLNLATIIINSTPITLNLSMGQIERIDFNNDKVLDLEVSCLNISYSNAEIKIKEINEEIPVRVIFNETFGGEEKIENNAKSETLESKGMNFGILISLGVVLILSGIFYFLHKHLEHKK